MLLQTNPNQWIIAEHNELWTWVVGSASWLEFIYLLPTFQEYNIWLLVMLPVNKDQLPSLLFTTNIETHLYTTPPHWHLTTQGSNPCRGLPCHVTIVYSMWCHCSLQCADCKAEVSPNLGQRAAAQCLMTTGGTCWQVCTTPSARAR